MNRARRFPWILPLPLLLLGVGCAPRSTSRASLDTVPVPAASASAASAVRRRHHIETDDLALPLPDGYTDVSAAFASELPRGAVVLRADRSSLGYVPTITVRKVPIPGGTFDDPSLCEQAGKGLVGGGTEATGTGGRLLRAAIIDGPVGKTCQIHLRAPQGIALITELHLPGNTPATPRDIWLMTCNHADGDASAEATCRSTLAGFRFRIR